MSKSSKFIFYFFMSAIICISIITSKNVNAANQEGTTEETTTGVSSEEPTTAPLKKIIVSKLSPASSKVIVLDPGHCSEHLGARANGLKEEEVVLDIAKACKTELNKYGNVSVYMTRTTLKCCESLKLGDCLTARNNYAKRLDADFLISVHINADADPNKTGAMILPAYSSGYRDNIRVKTQAMGREILSSLHSLGIKNRGFWLRKVDFTRYPNGALADYYSIVRNGVLNNIPSLIIEHGYVTNASDCKKYFSTKAKRTELGVADANAIVSYYNLKENTITGNFVKKNGATYYMTKNNQKVKGWVKHKGKWYYFSKKNGKMRTGFVTIKKKKFYLNPSTGAMKVGWFKVKGYKYLAKGDGTVVKNTTYSDSVKTYLFSATGKKYTRGMHKINGKYYYVNPRTGTIVKNKTVRIHGKNYYFASNGVRK